MVGSKLLSSVQAVSIAIQAKLTELFGSPAIFYTIGHFTIMDGSEAEGDLVLIQTFFALLWKLFLKNNS